MNMMLNDERVVVLQPDFVTAATLVQSDRALDEYRRTSLV